MSKTAFCMRVSASSTSAVGLRFATPDGALPQLLDFRVQVVAGLFAQDLAEQGAERTNIAPQRGFLQFTGASL